MITIEFLGNSDKYMGWAEVTAGIGLSIGPVIGSLIYQFSTYLLTFVIYGVIILLGGIAMIFALPNSSNGFEKEDESSNS